MDLSNTISNTYSNEEHITEARYRKKYLRKVITISLLSFLLLLLVAGITAGTLIPRRKKPAPPSAQPSTDQSIVYICSITQYPESCNWSLSSFYHKFNKSISKQLGIQDLVKLSLQVSLDELSRLSSTLTADEKFNINGQENPVWEKALNNCRSLIKDAIEHIKMSIPSTSLESLTSNNNHIRTWLSTAITSQEACTDGLTESTNQSTLLHSFTDSIRNSKQFTSNSLAIVSNILTLVPLLHFPKRNLLQTTSSSRSLPPPSNLTLNWYQNPDPDLVVAKDGSGNFETITEAVAAIPKMRKKRFTIYIKKGEYVENVELNRDLWNVLMYGDGMFDTVVSGSLNVVNHTPTYSTATFAVNGRGFVAKDMGFKNTAGPKKLQAVAVRSSSDKSVFFRCSFDAYQDTLYALSNRQFYRDCVVIGTIDFIFGNAAVVFQNCRIRVRQPLPGQFNAVTAQGKTDPNQNTGTSVHKCRIDAYDEVLTARTYLGRPWKSYSTAVVMGTEMDALVDPMGWSVWLPGRDPPETVFYAEGGNTGPGSGLSGRVKWRGYERNMSDEEKEEFSVKGFIQGDEWLPETGVKYE
ncbi:unnamed protein product [Rhodiola kirilowii]